MSKIEESGAVLAKHELLEERCHDLHEALTKRDRPLTTAEHVARELCRQLCEQFRHEEPGYLQTVIRRAPWLTDAATALQAQHRELRQALERIVAQLDRPRLSAMERMAVSADFDNFVVKFQEHEQRENHLLQEAMDRDVGNND